VHISLFTSARATASTPVLLDGWCDLGFFMQEQSQISRRRDTKLDCPAMISGLCEGRRANANVRHLSFFAGDFDIAPDDPRYMTFQARCDWLDEAGFTYIAYTTTANCASHHRYRVLLPLPCDVPRDRWLPVWRACSRVFSDAIDIATKDPARLSFLPADWTGNPFWDAGKNKTITLVEPFNAFRTSRAGALRPVISQSGLDAIDASDPFIQFGDCPLETAFSFRNSQPARPKPVPTYLSDTSPLTPAELSELSRGAPPAAPCWRIIGRLESSPLVSPWMREELPRQEGSRVHRFCLYAALNAVKHMIPITPHTLADLAAQWSTSHLFRPAPADTLRQAENALVWAIRNPSGDTPPLGNGQSTPKEKT